MPKNALIERFKKVKLDGFNCGMQLAMDLMTITLNEHFGFGKDRLTRCAKEFNKLYIEYGEKLIEVEGNVERKRLERRIKQIMREE